MGKTRQYNIEAAILIVNGGQDLTFGKWIKLCLDKIAEYTEYESYHIYVWNNNVTDLDVEQYILGQEKTTLLRADPDEKLAHPHAVPLQRLYECSLNDSPEYIITLDSDAHPIKKGWLQLLINQINEQTVLAGVWRDELKSAIEPYLHASCLCTTVKFIEENNLRLDYIAANENNTIHDTLSSFTELARAQNLGMYKLKRSNNNQVHRLIGGIYGDLIYHHGAGSRDRVSFWDEANKSEQRQKANAQIGFQSAELLFSNYNSYMDWLRGIKGFKCSIANLFVYYKLKKLTQMNKKLVKA